MQEWKVNQPWMKPKLPEIFTFSRIKNPTIHRQAIADIVAALFKAGITNINYDHVKTIVPKHKVPLWIDRRRLDIAYRKDGVVVWIEILAARETDVEIVDREDG